MRVFRYIKVTLRKFKRELFCRHMYQRELIFSHSEPTHYDIQKCFRCGKSYTEFAGSREEWRVRHGLEEQTK